jgi:flagellar biosynthesis protein FlhG
MIKTLSETVETFLKCRLHILGGIKKEDVAEDRFDTVLLQEENNSLHKNFVNIINKFTDEIESANVQDMQFNPRLDQFASLTV